MAIREIFLITSEPSERNERPSHIKSVGATPRHRIRIAWREAWKYGDRAYRYCLHDIGHAWQSLTLAARAMGCDSFAIGEFEDDLVASACRLHQDEWPMLVVELRGASIPTREPDPAGTVWHGGRG